VQTNISQITQEASEIQGDEFIQLAEKARQLVANENGEVGNLSVIGRLVKVKPLGEAVVIGDLHGDMESLVRILEESDFLRRANQKDGTTLVFLGDYGDRGAYSAEVYYIVLKLKLHFPHKVVLMRGNHEGPEDLLPYPHDLPTQFRVRFGEKGAAAYLKIRDLFEHLYSAVIVDERYLMIHGGLPAKANTIDDLAYAHTRHPEQSFLEEMLWNDPNEMIRGLHASPRGAGKLFGQDITERVLNNFSVKILVRGHEACEDGFEINHGGGVLTLFSRKGPPYFNSYGAYLDVKLSKTFENAEQLATHIHRF
jgi:diadenosine tetraphosphatase ApaH/serine/threonine PP2A family protein phosphatase